MKNYKTALKGIIGENLVTAELARRDIVATTFTGNIPDIDILAFKDYKTIPLQVKTLTKRSLHIADLTKYLKIERKGKKQIIKGLNKINEKLIFVIVKIGEKYIDALHFNFSSMDQKLNKKKKLNTDVWYDESNLNWVKASFDKVGKWEYKLSSIQ